MNPDYSDNNYRIVKVSLNRKRQIINAVLNNLHNTQLDMIDQAVNAKEYAGFPEAQEVINYIKSL